jgi:hypothetical protein
MIKIPIGPQAFVKAKSSHGGFLAYAKNVRTKTSGNATLAMPAAMVDAFGRGVDALDAAQIKAGSRLPDDVADRNAKAVVVYRGLKQIVAFVQCVADEQPTPADAAAVILGAGLDVRKKAPYTKPDLCAKYTGRSGEARIVARAVKDAGAYFWESSTDQEAWTAAAETTAPEVVITGLVPGQVYYFRFRALTPEGKGDHSRLVALMAH